MAASVTCAASRQQTCCKCEQLLREQSLHQQKTGLSAPYQFVRCAAKVRYSKFASFALGLVWADSSQPGVPIRPATEKTTRCTAESPL
jgi:hypothetical protein